LLLAPANITLGQHERCYLLFHLLTTLAKLIRPGGSRTVIAENLLLKQQLIIRYWQVNSQSTKKSGRQS